MVACGTLKGRYSLDNSSKPQTLNPNPRKGWHSQKSESWLAWEDSARGTAQLRARDTAWSSGQKGSYTAGGNISSCEITPRDQMDLLCSTRWTFFAVQFEIPGVFCLLIGFILIIKSVYWCGQDDENHGLIFSFLNLMPTKSKLCLQDEENLKVFNI